MDFSSVIKTVAPWIGTALGGPLGGMALEAAASAFGIPDKTTEALKVAVSGASPEQMLVLKTADQKFAADMQSLGFAHIEALENLSNDDRANARQREVEVKDITPTVLAYGVTLGFFAVLGAIMFADIPPSGRDVLNIMLGSLGTAWTGVVAYYFGSSSGSDRKTELLAKSNQ